MNFAQLKNSVLVASIAALLLTGRAVADTTSSAKLESAVLTISPRGYAQIDAHYNFKLSKGLNRVVLDRLPTSIVTSSIGTDQFSGPITLGPVSYRPANLSPHAIEERLINKQVTLITAPARATDSPGSEQGVLLSFDGHTAVIKDADGLIRKVPNVQGWKCNPLPEGLYNTPSLTIVLESDEDGECKGVIRYRTAGFSYSVTHAWEYDEKNSTIKWSSDVHVKNQSGGQFSNVELNFAAGDTGADEAEMADNAPQFAPAAAAPSATAGLKMMRAPTVREAAVEDLAGVQVFTIPSKVTIENAEQQKIPFFRSPATVKVQRDNRLSSYGLWYTQYSRKETLENQKVATILNFGNSKSNGLGQPIPHGKVTVEARNARGDLKPIGGASLADIAVDEKSSYQIGSDWNLKGTRKVLNFTQTKPARVATPEGASDKTEEGDEVRWFQTISTWELATELTNGKDRDVDVIVEESANGTYVLQGDHGFKQVREGHYEQIVRVPANNKTEIRYTVKRVDVQSYIVKRPRVTPPPPGTQQIMPTVQPGAPPTRLPAGSSVPPVPFQTPVNEPTGNR